jgi:hypothetical protein
MEGKRRNSMTDTMPDEIYVTPRGSGTCSGIYVDIPLGDEPRGEHKYVRADRPSIAAELVEALKMALHEIDNAPHEAFKNITVEDEGIIIDGKELVPILEAARLFLAAQGLIARGRE